MERRDLTIGPASLPLCWERPKDLGLPLVLGGTQFETDAEPGGARSGESAKKLLASTVFLIRDFKISLTTDQLIRLCVFINMLQLFNISRCR